MRSNSLCGPACEEKVSGDCTFSRRQGPGRKRKIPDGDDPFLGLSVLRNRSVSSVFAQHSLRNVRNLNFTEWNIRRRLRDLKRA